MHKQFVHLSGPKEVNRGEDAAHTDSVSVLLIL